MQNDAIPGAPELDELFFGGIGKDHRVRIFLANCIQRRGAPLAASAAVRNVSEMRSIEAVKPRGFGGANSSPDIKIKLHKIAAAWRHQAPGGTSARYEASKQ